RPKAKFSGDLCRSPGRQKRLMISINPISNRARTLLVSGIAALLLLIPLDARQTLDRTKIPPPGAPPVLRVPNWTKSKLANGADLVVSAKHDLPHASFAITFLSGSNQFEPADRAGISGIVASMMSDGTKTRSGDALSSALQLLGVSLNTSIAGETGSISFLSTTSKFGPTLEVLADVLLNSNFPADALERQRAQRLVALSQARDRTGAIAGVVFPKLLYGDAHPYGRSPNEHSIKAITRDEVATFYNAYFKPGRAIVVVVGDVTGAGVKPLIDRALAAWTGGGEKPSFSYPPVPERKPTTIYLVDKPAAAQSSFALANPGPPRSTADYFALQVM